MSNANSIYNTANNIAMGSITDKCIILDLDQTLIATQESITSLYSSGILENPNLLDLRQRVYFFNVEDPQKPGIGTQYSYWGIFRPHAKEFVKFCFNYFKIVAVWSAGQRCYVEAIVNRLFEDTYPPHVVLTHDDTLFPSNGIVEKPILKLITSHILLNHNMDLSNTLALDDNPTTFAHNPRNGILIPAYDPKGMGSQPPSIADLRQDDRALIDLQNWLLFPQVQYASDVRDLDKSNIFISR